MYSKNFVSDERLISALLSIDAHDFSHFPLYSQPHTRLSYSPLPSKPPFPRLRRGYVADSDSQVSAEGVDLIEEVNRSHGFAECYPCVHRGMHGT